MITEGLKNTGVSKPIPASWVDGKDCKCKECKCDVHAHNAPLLADLVKRASLDRANEYTSIEHFIAKAKELLDKAETMYYAPTSTDKEVASISDHDTQCDIALSKAIEVIELAKLFNENFGF